MRGRQIAAWILPSALLSLGAIYVFRGAFHLFFAQEDFRGLAVAAGVYPRHAQLWRYVSVQTFMDVFYPFFRNRPWPYHAISVALHCLNAGLLFSLLSKKQSRPAALLGASFFAVHPALFTALYWMSARADILSAAFALLTVFLALGDGRKRWLAVPTFVLSLLSKESSLLLPAVIVLLRMWRKLPDRPGPRTGLDPLEATLGLVSLACLFYLAGARRTGIQMTFGSEAAYALDFGTSIVGNLLTYVGWTVDLAMLRPGLRFVDHQDPGLYGLAAWVLIGVGLLACWRALRERGWLVGACSFFLFLAPVLPLRNHAYHYYLYLPLTAASLCLAALMDSLFSLADRRRLSWGVACICWLVLAWNGARVVTQMEVRPSPAYPGLRGDPIVDRSLIAERAITGLRATAIPPGTELVFILRERLSLVARIVRGSGEPPPPTQEIYPETNVRTALFDGIGVRAFFPAVDSVTFALSLGQPTVRRRYVVYAPTGETEVYDAASLDSLLRSSWVTRW